MGGSAAGDAAVRHRLIERSRRLSVAEFDGGERSAVSASVIRALCREPARIDPFGLRLAGARIEGALDLSAIEVQFPLAFSNCTFDEPVDLTGSRVHSLAITGGSVLPGLLGNGLRVDGDLDLGSTLIRGSFTTSASTTSTSAVWLTEADVGGRLLCAGTRFDTRADRCIQADRAHFGSSVRLIDSFRTNAEVRLLTVHIDGSLDLSGASLVPANGRALDVAESVIAGSVFILDDPRGTMSTIVGRIELGHTSVGGRVLIRDSSLTAPQPGSGGHHYHAVEPIAHAAMTAPRLKVAGDVIIEGGCAIVGGIDLTKADIRGDLRADGLTIDNAGDDTLVLTNAEIGGDLSARSMRCRGTVDLSGAHIGGKVDLTNCSLSEPRAATGTAPDMRLMVSADGLGVGRDVNLVGATATGGEIRLRGARIGGSLRLGGAMLSNPQARTITLYRSTVVGTLRLDRGFRSLGLAAFNRSTITGRFVVTDASFSWDGRCQGSFNARGAAFEARGARAEGGLVLGWRSVSGHVDLTDAFATWLADRPDRWGDGHHIAGFTFERLAGFSEDASAPEDPWALEPRLAWLQARADVDYGSYEVVARAYRSDGRASDAETVLIEGRRHARRVDFERDRRPFRRHLRRIREWVLDRSVGYGYRPGRAGALLLGLVATTAILLSLPAADHVVRATDPAGRLYGPDGQALDPLSGATVEPCGDGRVRCFNALLYAVDTVVPVIDLGQRTTWHPHAPAPYGRAYEWWLNAVTVAGWVATTVIVLSFARLARNGPAG